MFVHGFICDHGILVIPCYHLFLIWPRLFRRWIALSTKEIIIKRISVNSIALSTILWIVLSPFKLRYARALQLRLHISTIHA